MLKRFIAYYKPHELIFTLDMIASFLVALIGMGYPIITRLMLNDFIPNQKWNLIVIGGVSLFVVYLIRLGLRYFIQYYGHVMGVRMQAQMRSDMFVKLEKLPYSFYDNNETGKIMSRMTNDLFDISELAHHGPENIFIAGFTIIGAFIYLALINWVLALICFAMVPILFGITFYFRKRMRAAFVASRVAIAKVNASLESSISGIRVTKAYNNSDIEQEKFEETNQEFVNARKSAFSAMASFFASSQFVTDVFNVLVLIAGGLFLYGGQISFGDYSTFIVSINLFIAPVNQLINFMEQFQNGASGFKRFLEIMDEAEEIDNGTIEIDNVKGDIEFKNVLFSYDKSKGILKDVSFKIDSGKTIALVGPTGGGKSTICHLIPRFYNIDDGEILLDDINISNIKLQSLREQIGIVQQDVFLFGGSIRDNILYGRKDASEEEIIEACKNANIFDFVQTLEKGLDTEVGERGVRLSGGQKQRISIARLFLKNPKILILDEATSALDNTTEMLIQNALDKLAKGRTTIVVAHRLTTIKNADEILVVTGGEILEKGSHEELMKLDGAYRKLYDLQFRNINDEDSEIINKQIAMNS